MSDPKDKPQETELNDEQLKDASGGKPASKYTAGLKDTDDQLNEEQLKAASGGRPASKYTAGLKDTDGV